MSDVSFIKYFADPARAAASRAHWQWLKEIDHGVRIPGLQCWGSHWLGFENLGDRQVSPADFRRVAVVIGRMHRAANRAHLHKARLDRDFVMSDSLVIPSFTYGREQCLTQFGVRWDAPVAFYKDANVRNFMATGSGIAAVDFDDLTLAPFGYDLAKLVVSTAMTWGAAIREDDIAEGLALYNYEVRQIEGAACSARLLACFCEMHHQLTSKYLHANGYRFAWPDVRPWR